jgi:membrane dipeptidase
VKLHQDALVADLHCDTVLRLKKGTDFAIRDTTGHIDLPKLDEGGIDLQVFACWVPTQTPKEVCRPKVDEMLDTLEHHISRHTDKIAICKTAAEAENIIASGRIAAFLAIENGVALAGEINNLDHFYGRGVRYLTLTHTASSDWCISSGDTAPAFEGLTDFGREVVRRMDSLGMIIDVSHASVKAVEQVLKITKNPIIASHSCVYDICKHDRNLTDEQIRAIAANGGVIGINFFGGYLSDRWNEVTDSITASHQAEIDSISEMYKDDYGKRHAALAWLFDEMNGASAKVGIDVGLVIDHIDHIVKLVGPDYVGLGSDYDGVFSLPAGLEDCSKMPNITRELVRRGYSETDIRKILGENFMRVFRKVCS